MTRRRDHEGRRSEKVAIADRVRSIREEVFGKDGSQALAEQLDLPQQTWLNYENGVTIPGEVMLNYLLLTGAEPLWIHTGGGARFRHLACLVPDEPA